MQYNNQSSHISLVELINIDSLVNIVDLGALMYENNPPNYQVLLDLGLAHIIGFEPNEKECLKLKDKYNNHEYYPYAIGDGKEHTFYSTKMPSCSSLLEPDLSVLNDFYSFPEWMEVTESTKIKTHRLDDLLLGKDIDFIKLDIQGGELMALENSIEILNSTVAIEIEVEFIPQYKHQPLFSEIEIFLRSKGFMFHSFLGYGTRSIKPILKANDPNRGFRQWIWSDAVFTKNLWLENTLSELKLLKLALILNDVYQSYDLAYFALKQSDLKFNTSYAPKYHRALKA
jgi:FkbM family methyltransferase